MSSRVLVGLLIFYSVNAFSAGKCGVPSAEARAAAQRFLKHIANGAEMQDGVPTWEFRNPQTEGPVVLRALMEGDTPPFVKVQAGENSFIGQVSGISADGKTATFRVFSPTGERLVANGARVGVQVAVKDLEGLSIHEVPVVGRAPIAPVQAPAAKVLNPRMQFLGRNLEELAADINPYGGEKYPIRLYDIQGNAMHQYDGWVLEKFAVKDHVPGVYLKIPGAKGHAFARFGVDLDFKKPFELLLDGKSWNVPRAASVEPVIAAREAAAAAPAVAKVEGVPKPQMRPQPAPPARAVPEPEVQKPPRPVHNTGEPLIDLLSNTLEDAKLDGKGAVFRLKIQIDLSNASAGVFSYDLPVKEIQEIKNGRVYVKVAQDFEKYDGILPSFLKVSGDEGWIDIHTIGDVKRIIPRK